MIEKNLIHNFTVVRFDREGDLSPTYLRDFTLAGAYGLKQFAFDERAEAYIFEDRAEAEDVARRLRRRISAADYDYRVEEVAQEPVVSS